MSDDQKSQNNTTHQGSFECSSGDGSKILVDTPDTYPGDVVLSISFPKRHEGAPFRFVIVSPDMAREIAAALMDCATVAELEGHHASNTTATFYRHEIEMLINRALAIRDPLIMRSGRWVRWSKKVAASDAALFRFHEYAAAALTRFGTGDQNGQ